MRLHWPSAYFSSSEALKERNCVATRVTEDAATKYEVRPASTTADTMRGRTTSMILSRMLIYRQYNPRSGRAQARGPRGKGRPSVPARRLQRPLVPYRYLK